MHAFNTPQGIIGHELRHIFDGRFHGALPFAGGVQYTDAERRELLHNQHGATVLVERCGDANCLRVPGDTSEADCTFYTRTEDVSYIDMGGLFMACWEAKKNE